MTNDVARFGSPDRFQVSLGWLCDDGPLDDLPKHHGWSLGKLAITVAGVNLTISRSGERTQDGVVWFQGPFLHWLAENWITIFHQEHFAWPERSEGGAALVCSSAISRFSIVGQAQEGALDRALQWYNRHGMSSASAGGLYPDVFIRRFGDDVELSWTANPPPFAPKGFTFETVPGLSRLPIKDVAEPLWGLLSWVSNNPPLLETKAFKRDHHALSQSILALDQTEPARFDAVDLKDEVLQPIHSYFESSNRSELFASARSTHAPYVASRAPAVAMFGGVYVDLSTNDISTLLDLLVKAAEGAVPSWLPELTDATPLRGKPWQDGYNLADTFLDWANSELFDSTSREFVDVEYICSMLEISVFELTMDVPDIRGVALAGESLAPTIVVNNRSKYNQSGDGHRFTIAHELCHILHDQSRAKEVAHTSGPWAAPGVEKRANAFAAWLLMPPTHLTRQVDKLSSIDEDFLRNTARKLQVADSALVEHLYNLSLIDVSTREKLRWSVRP